MLSRPRDLTSAWNYLPRQRRCPPVLENCPQCGSFSLDSDDAYPSSRFNLSMELSPSTATMPTRPRELTSAWKFLPRQRRWLPVLEIQPQYGIISLDSDDAYPSSRPNDHPSFDSNDVHPSSKFNSGIRVIYNPPSSSTQKYFISKKFGLLSSTYTTYTNLLHHIF